MDRIDLYTSIVPNRRQLIIQEMKYYAFVHYGINTFTNREWGNGKESEKLFNPKKQNTDQWCEAIAAAGMKGVILTCKHHDGFCLWPTETTEHSIKNSPYKNGKGDVVREVSESCKKYGLKFGVYLSPWDRNAECYGTPEYNDFYIRQLTELLTNYGDIFMLWLDGACGAKADGQPVQKYDFERIWNTAVELQPDIVMSGCAPDVRWIGNESGKTRESEWNVVPKFEYDQQNFAANCQTDDDMKKFQKRCQDVMLPDMNGFQLCQKIREKYQYPVIMLTAKGEEIDKITGLTLGADDYITKPFSLMVLRARVDVQLRKSKKKSEVFCDGPFLFDFRKMEFFRDNVSLELSKTEQRLLRCLTEKKGGVSRTQLIDFVWQGDTEYVDDHALTVAVNRLRGKLGEDKECIRTVYGIGYAWVKQ